MSLAYPTRAQFQIDEGLLFAGAYGFGGCGGTFRVEGDGKRKIPEKVSGTCSSRLSGQWNERGNRWKRIQMNDTDGVRDLR